MIPFPTILAVWTMLTCTSPTNATGLRLEAQRCSSLDGCQPAKIYNTANAADSLVYARVDGDTLRMFVSVTTSANVPYGSRRGGQMVYVRARGCEDWGNGVALTVADADTLWTDGRGWQWAKRGDVVRFVRAYGDSELAIYEGPGPVDRMEGAITRGNWRTVICYIYGRWPNKGGLRACP